MSVILLGATGKLGSLITEVLQEQKISYISLSRDVLNNTKHFLSFMEAIKESSVILDVSLTEGTIALGENLLSIYESNKIILKNIYGLVIGTTGHNVKSKNIMESLAKIFPICLVSNFSKGVFLFEEILKATTSNGMKVYELARSLGFDLGLHEVHHTLKKDAPSGTALTLAEAANILDPYKMSSLRVGNVVGEHTILASSAFEQLSITHSAYHRKLFALGAVDLCKNILSKKPPVGFLNKKDFLV